MFRLIKKILEKKKKVFVGPYRKKVENSIVALH